MRTIITADRYHDFSYGHRVYGHENKCAHLHGHNGRATFTVVTEELDNVGRVLDFSVIKSGLCNWLEANWDHKFLVWCEDPLRSALFEMDSTGVVFVPFNPTAENMAKYLLHEVGPSILHGTGCELSCVRVDETRKCSATARLGNG